MFDGTYYAVQFENGRFFTGSHTIDSRGDSERVEDAFLYRLDFEAGRDPYLKIFLRSYNLKYKIVRVRVKKSFEVLE